MRDLAEDLRDYFDAIVDGEPPAATADPPRRRIWLPAAAALAVVAATVAVVANRPREQPAPPAVAPTPTPAPTPAQPEAVTEEDGFRLSVRLTSTAPFTVVASVENVSGVPKGVAGSLEPDQCRGSVLLVSAVRVAWAPGRTAWLGADRYLDVTINHPGWSNSESRGTPFADPLVEEARRQTMERFGSIACDLVGRSASLAPGQRIERTFTWTPPAGWPGGDHDIVLSVWPIDGRSQRAPAPTARLPITVQTPVADQLGPEEALLALKADPDFQAALAAGGGVQAVTTEWAADRWKFLLHYLDNATARWAVDNAGRVSRTA